MCFRDLGRQVGVASLSPASVDVRQPCYSNGGAVLHRHHAASLTQIASRLIAGFFGALGGTRTPTILLTATSRQRVYQFRHERFKRSARDLRRPRSTAPM